MWGERRSRMDPITTPFHLDLKLDFKMGYRAEDNVMGNSTNKDLKDPTATHYIVGDNSFLYYDNHIVFEKSFNIISSKVAATRTGF